MILNLGVLIFIDKLMNQQWNIVLMYVAKGWTKLKWNFQADVSSKKRTNEFIFTTMQRVFICFVEEIEDSKKAFQNYLTINIKNLPNSVISLPVSIASPRTFSSWKMYRKGIGKFVKFLASLWLGLDGSTLKKLPLSFLCGSQWYIQTTVSLRYFTCLCHTGMYSYFFKRYFVTILGLVPILISS